MPVGALSGAPSGTEGRIDGLNVWPPSLLRQICGCWPLSAVYAIVCRSLETYTLARVTGAPVPSRASWHSSAGTGSGIGGEAFGAHASVKDADGPGAVVAVLTTPVSRTI